jgi:DNA-binding NarL/FixJ family response regulator
MYSILIIEDDPSYINIMETILQMEGFSVRTASDGMTGLVLARDQRPDLILCDIMMPDMDGLSLLEALKGDTALTVTPFIFVTALGDRDDIRRGMSAGADDYLTKPFSADELIAAVTGRIRHHEMILQQRDKSAFQKEESIFRTRNITRQERVVLQMVGRGAISRDIAEQLGVAVKTVEVHRANLMNKLGAANAAGLARWAVIAELMERDS